MAVVLAVVATSRDTALGTRYTPASDTVPSSIQSQIDALLNLRAMANGTLGDPSDQEKARAIWNEIIGNRVRTKPDTYASNFTGSDRCPDPSKRRSAFALNPNTSYVYPRSMLTRGGATAGYLPGRLAPVGRVSGVWIEAVATPPSQSQVDFHIFQCTVNKSAGAVVTSETVSLPLALEDIAPPETKSDTSSHVLFVDFEDAPKGPYNESRAIRDWGNKYGELTSYIARPADSLLIREENRNRYLVKSFPQGSFNNSANREIDHKMLLDWRFDEKVAEIYFSYRTRTSSNFTPVKGGKLPGLCGGECPTGGRPSTDSELEGKRNNPVGNAIGWSGRGMWRRNGHLVQYLYYPDQVSEYGTDFRYSLNQSDVYISDGMWHTIENRIKMNDPGKSNGVFEAWYDGRKVLSLDNVRYRDSYDYGIDLLRFTTYFGGHDESWAPKQNVEIHFDDVILSRNPISH